MLNKGSIKAISKIWKQLLFNRRLQMVVAAFTIYALLGFLLIPWMISNYASNFVTEKLKRKISVAEVNVNPFFFTFEVKTFNLDEADGRPILGCKRLFVNFELSSLFRWAWTFADIKIENPSLYLEIQKKDGRLNLQALSDSLPKSDKSNTADSRPPRLIIQHIEITDGGINFSDQTVSTPIKKIFQPLNLELKDISTLKDRKGPYSFTAMLPGGGRIGWQGEVSLHPIYSEGELSLSGLELSLPWEFMQDKLNLGEPKGEMDFSAQYRFDYKDNIAGLILKESKLKLNKISLAEKGKKDPMLAISAVEANNISFDLIARELIIPDFNIRKGNISASVNEKGTINWQNIITSHNFSEKDTAKDNAPKSDGDPWTIKVNGLAIEDVAVNYTDYSRAKPLAANAIVSNVLLNLSAKVGKGLINAILDGLKAKLSNVLLSEAGNDNPVISLNTIELNDGQIDVGLGTVKLTGLGAAGGKTNLLRNKDGHLQLLELLVPGKKAKTNSQVAEIDSQARAESKPWSYSLDKFELKDYHVTLQDQTLSPAVSYDLQDIRVLLTNIANKSEKPIDFETALNVKQGGNLTISGQVSQSADYADVNARIKDISLEPLRPLLNKFTYLELESGKISTSAVLHYRSSKSGPKINAEGFLNVNKFRLNETETGKRFIEWKDLAANKIKLGISPDKLQIKDVKLIKPGARIIVFKDRSVNLARILKSPDKSAMKTAAQSKPFSSASSDEKNKDFPISIERIRIEKGVVDFADLSLVLPFSTRITDFEGKASKICSDPSIKTELKFDGKVGDFGSSSVEGSLSAFSPKTFTDIAVLFNNVEMTPLSPYSATFAGRKIASGKLNLKLEYKIKNSELLGNNSVVLEKFTLGERVKSPGAVNLPLDLAIALLSDNEGKINFAVPVSGNVDNPQFQYGHLIRKAIINLITKIVTSPFRALGGLFGGKGEQVGDISFYPGKDRLQPSELKKLEIVAEALKKRPQLNLAVLGRFDSKADGEAIRTERVNRALAERMQDSPLSPEEEPEMIEFDDAKTQRSLEKQLETVGGKKAIGSFKTEYEKSSGKKPKPVKSYMAIFGRESSDTGYYEAIFKELVRLEPLIEKDLLDLARRRADAIINAIISIKGFDRTRVTAGTPGPSEKASKETVNTKLTLEVLKTTRN